jgi:flagellar protein FlaG
MSGQKAPPELHLPEKIFQTQSNTEEKPQEKSEMSKEEIDVAMEALTRAASIFNKRLKFSVNEEIGMVIVKIVDAETDKVIKEIPPTEIQKLIARLKETIGLLIDEKI